MRSPRCSGHGFLVPLAALCLIGLLGGRTVWAADFFVAPDGNDAWSGRAADASADKTDGPFATIQRAQRAVRELKQQQPDRQQPIIVEVRGGTYWLAEPVQFGPEDSGSEKSPVVYQAHGDERPVLSGGRRHHRLAGR